jgi:hypothetical protein
MPQKPADTPGSGAKLFLRDEGRRGHASGFPADVLAQSARRLRVLCLLYAFVFFMSRFFTALFFPEGRADLLSGPAEWAPGAVAIAVALVVAALTRIPQIPLPWVMHIGLGFEVVGSYGIAAAEFSDPSTIDFNTRFLGLSWVAVWTLLYAVVVPNRPRRTAVAALASVSAVPVVIGLVVATHPTPGVTFTKFFFGLVFPYLLVAMMAYVGSRVLYSLGEEVARARELGGYRLVERLGAGGMGEVWRAEHYVLARPAAIKLVRPEALGASEPARRREAQERFEREAQATAMMRSPHTVELYDFGMANDGTFYYVMELLDGFDFEALVQRFGPVPAERVVHYLTQLCHSLGEAHGEGLIHRDIKPANVFVCRYGREVDFVKVLDFGMVKSQREGRVEETQLTADHAVLGTPAFMAPEQVLGHRPVDGRTDLYAVGCLAYWLIAGRPVFEGGTAMEVMMQHAQAAPSTPSAHTELQVPEALDRLVLDCLAKDPEDRPATADLLAERLGAIELPSAWTASRAREWWDRHHPAAPRASAAT